MKINKKPKSYLMIMVLLLLSGTVLRISAQQNDIMVKGMVMDETGTAMNGVTVTPKGGTAGTVTDGRGNFEIKASPSAVLEFHCPGYSGQEVQVDSRTNITVTMEQSTQSLDEIVVVGYGTARKKDLTGGIAVVGQQELEMVSTSNLMDRLVGQIAGLSITSSSASPGSNQTLLIRGTNSISASNSPLIILDGIPYNGGLADIDPNIVDNMTVLKDASSVAIYGSRGSNGVILIQTKTGQKGKTNVSYKGTFGLAEPMQRIQAMGPNEYIKMKQDYGRINKGYTGDQLDPIAGNVISASEKVNYAKGITHDWQDYVFRQVFTMDHQVSLNGGSDKTAYMASVAYLDNPGVVYNSNYKRISVYGNITQTLNKWLSTGITTQYINRNTGGVTPNIEHAIKQSPYGIYKDDAGYYYEEPMDYSNLPNPMKDVNADNKNTTNNILVNGFAEILFPVKGLSFKSQFGYNFRNNFTGTYYGRDTSTGKKVNGRGSVSTSNNMDYTWENVIRYGRTFGKHRLDLTGLFSMQEQKSISASESGESFVNDDSSFYRLSGGESNIAISSSYSKENMLSYMFRANYAFNDKYLFTFTARADGASVFGDNNKYGFFPSAAFAWHLGDEHFVKDNASWIDMLKIRLSYGANGNNAISRYQTLDRLYSTNKVKYIFGDGGDAMNAAYFPTNGKGNPNLKWETTYTANLGIDFQFWGGRLGGTVDMYIANTKDILMTRTVPIMNGYRSIYDNIGETLNKGIEIALNSENIRTADFTWSTGLNFFLNRDKIVELRGDGKDDVGNKWFIGQPLSVYYDYYMVGLWQKGDITKYIDADGNEKSVQTDTTPGSAKVEDIDGNGYIDEKDRKIIGSRLPNFTMSMSNRFQYKNFYFSFLVNGVFGKWMENNVANISSYTFGAGNYIQGASYWTPENTGAEYVSPGYANSLGHGYYKKMTYVQIKNLTFGYRVDPKFVKRLGMSAIDINVSVNNPHAFSNMRQMLNYDNTWFASFPTARSYVLGVTLNF